MGTHSGNVRNKGQITLPAEIRKRYELRSGSRVVFEEREGYIALIPAEELVDDTAGALASYAQDAPSLTKDAMAKAASVAIAEENLETLQQIERDHACH